MTTGENLWMEDLLKKMEWWQVDTEKEYKEFEKRLQKDENEAALVKAIDEWKWAEIIALFWKDMLNQKVEVARSPEWAKKMKPEVRKAYLVLWELMDKWSSATWYNKLAENAESDIKWKNALNTINKKIDNNKSWSEADKKIAKDNINEIFKDCNSLEEFERRAWIVVGTVDTIDDIGDFLASIPAFVEKVWKNMTKAGAEFLRKCGVAADKIAAMCKDAVETGRMKMSEFVEWCKAQGQTVVDISKTVLSWWWNQFKNLLNYLEWIKDWVQEALSAAWEQAKWDWGKFVNRCGGISDTIADFWLALAKKWELAWKSLLESVKNSKEKVQATLNAAWEAAKWSWNDFVNMCGGATEAVLDFWAKLVEQGKLEWKVFVASLKNNYEKAKAICISLIEKWKIAINDVIERCKDLGKKWIDLIVGLIETGKATWNAVANWCVNHRNAAKNFFKDIASTLLKKWKLLLNDFVSWCKWAWETVKQTACNILFGLVKAWKFTLKLVVDTLCLAIWATIALFNLLIDAWKQIYQGAAALIKFIWNLAALAWKRGVNMIKSLIDKCKALWLKTLELLKWLRNSLKAAGMKALDFIKATAEAVKAAFQSGWKKIVEWFQKLWMWIKDVLTTLLAYGLKAWTGLKEFVLNAFNAIGDAISFLMSQLGMTLNAVWAFIIGLGKKTIDFLKYVIHKGWMTLQNVMAWCGNVWSKAVDIFKTAINSLKATFSDIFKWLGNSLAKLKDVVVAAFWTAWQGLKNCITWLGKGAIAWAEFLLEMGITLTGALIYAVYSLVKSFINVAKWAGNCLKKAGYGLYNAAKKLVEMCSQYFKNMAHDVCEALYAVWWDIVNVWKAVAEAIKWAYNVVRDWIYARTKDIKKAVKAVEKWLWDNIKGVYNWMKQKWLSVIDACKVILDVFADTFTKAVKILYDAGVSVKDLIAAWWKRILNAIGL